VLGGNVFLKSTSIDTHAIKNPAKGRVTGQMKTGLKQFRVRQGGNLSQVQIHGRNISSTNFDQIRLNRGKSDLKFKKFPPAPSVLFSLRSLLLKFVFHVPSSAFRVGAAFGPLASVLWLPPSGLRSLCCLLLKSVFPFRVRASHSPANRSKLTQPVPPRYAHHFSYSPLVTTLSPPIAVQPDHTKLKCVHQESLL
jgi:hypothetical protein